MTNYSVHIYEDVVRFEDVDAAAIVYHPVYLTYAERARSQRLLDSGYSFKRLLDEGLGMVIAGVEMKYIRPLRLDDRFFVASQVEGFGKSIVNMTQAITIRPEDCSRAELKTELRQMERLHFFAHVKLVVVDKTMRPTPIPEWLMKLLASSNLS